MRSEAEELLRAFLRRWSTIDLDEETRAHLKADVVNVRVLLEIHECAVGWIEEAEYAPDRHWFAAKFQELEEKEGREAQ